MKSLSIDFKIFSFLFLGPRYINNVKELMSDIKDRPYNDTLNQIIQVVESNSYDKIATEFTSCFINDYKHVKCPPYESWYREKTVLGISAQKVMEEYIKYGIFPKKQLADHISTEFEFISFLLFVDRDDDARNFIKEHIMTWVPNLINDILENSKGKYTKLLAIALKQMLNYAMQAVFTI
ncbi:hypothetical protein DFR86_04050 [Acidianus sulfidivorans JP7]|uniref:Cytoplasmic chaperone TorD family protein n=1 Tax=Acidianus sulfidivorans JP7 TaxID=619593 RepID=A0A2U9IL90_9CREN|nr:molecular chaperone TorD family protein [Acidianus sulfidivorans]AWR96809.1 hypothetical protein DFR86_04050 [Acidianus sulfidivorans JP7]